MNFWPHILLIFLLVNLSCTGAKAPPQDQVVARVGQEELTAKNFAKDIMRRAKSLDAILVRDPAIIQRVKNSAIKDFMVQSFLKIWAKENNISIANSELDTEADRLQKNYPNTNAFLSALTKEGITLEEWRREVGNTLLERRLFQQLRATFATPSDSEIQLYYDHNKESFKKNKAVKVRQIVTDSEDGAKQLLKELKSGKSFAKLAEKYSISPEGKKGGITDWIDTTTLDVYEEAFNLRPGIPSNILKSPYGFHIIELLEKRPGGHQPLKEVKDGIRDTLMESKEQAAYSQWLETQIRKNKVYKNEPLIASLKVSTEDK